MSRPLAPSPSSPSVIFFFVVAFSVSCARQFGQFSPLRASFPFQSQRHACSRTDGVYRADGVDGPRKWKESKQHPSMLPGPGVPGCCLISFHFLWAIHPIRPVVQSSQLTAGGTQPFSNSSWKAKWDVARASILSGF